LGLVPEEPGASAEIAGQRELLSRLRAVVEAKDAENAVLRAELDAERELRRRLELRLVELERRLSMDSSDSGTPSSKERIGAAEARRARQQSERDRSKDRKRGGQPGHQGKGLARDPDPDENKDAEPPAQCQPGRRAGRGLAVGAGHRRGGRPESDRAGAAGPGVPVLRDGHVRGAAAGRARRLGVLRAGAERGGYLELSRQPGL
jgi:Family of unknown function (DUF6444)